MSEAASQMETELTGKCKGCGLLAKRPTKTETPQKGLFAPIPYYEIEAPERESGVLTVSTVPYWPGAQASSAVCMVGATQFPQATSYQVDSIAEGLELDRHCPEWQEWIPGLGPERHLELRLAQKLEEQRQVWELDRQRDTEEFQARLASQSEKFLSDLETERQKWQDNAERWPRRLFWPLAVLALLEVVGTIAQLVFPNGI